MSCEFSIFQKVATWQPLTAIVPDEQILGVPTVQKPLFNSPILHFPSMPIKRGRKKKQADSVSKSSQTKNKSVEVTVSAPTEKSTTSDQQLKACVAALQVKLRTMYTDCLRTGEQPHECKSQIMIYLRALETDAKLFATLQSKELLGKRRSQEEQDRQQELQKRYTLMKSNQEALNKAQIQLEMATHHYMSMQEFYNDAEHPTDSQTFQLLEAQNEYNSILGRVKRHILRLLQTDWVVNTVLAVCFFGALASAGHRAWIDATVASTVFLQEAKQLTQTIDATTDFIQASSREAMKWTVGAVGAAVGASNGLLFSSLFPGPRGKRPASVLSLAAMGVFAGVRLLAW